LANFPNLNFKGLESQLAFWTVGLNQKINWPQRGKLLFQELTNWVGWIVNQPFGFGLFD